MPFELKGDAPLTAFVKVRFSPEEKQRLRDDAELAGMTMSDFVRRRAFGRPVMAAADRAVISELRRLGGLFKHHHITSGGASSKETAEVIAELKAYAKKLMDSTR